MLLTYEGVMAAVDMLVDPEVMDDDRAERAVEIRTIRERFAGAE